MREKPANEQAINRLNAFIGDLYLRIIGNVAELKPGPLMNNYHVASRTMGDLKALKIIKQDGKKYTWLGTEEVTNQYLRRISLLVLDYRLKQTKKKVHYPFPELAAIGETLKDISERLVQIAVQNEKSLKTPKNDFKTNTEDLFRVDEQRLYLAGQVAGGVYSILNQGKITFQQISDFNDVIINITDDLYNKLLNKQKS